MGRAKEEVCEVCKGSGEEKSLTYGRVQTLFPVETLPMVCRHRKETESDR